MQTRHRHRHSHRPFKPRVVGSNPTGLTHFSSWFFFSLLSVLVAPPPSPPTPPYKGGEPAIDSPADEIVILTLSCRGMRARSAPQPLRLPGISGKVRPRAAGVA